MKKLFKIIIYLVVLLTSFAIFSNDVFATNGNINDLHYQTKLTSYVDDKPAMTIITPGQGCDKSVFSNYNGTFAYDEKSLIEKLRLFADADVYVAEMMENINDAESFKDFNLYLCEKGNVIDGTNYYEYIETPVDTICNFSKHAVIIFNQYYSNEFHDTVDSEFESMVDSISYDYKLITGNIPKVNLIGHSRGGLINLMYATEHPYNVSSLISSGTPYAGSAFANIEGLVNAIGLKNSVECNSGKDILNPTKQQELKNNWNKMISTNPNVNINAIAIGACTSSDFLEELFAGGYVDDKLYDFLGIAPEDASLLEELVFCLTNLAITGVAKYIDNHPNVINGVFKIVDLGIDITNCFSNKVIDSDREKIQKILNNCYLDYGKLVINDDMFIDYDSQTAIGFNGFKTKKKIFFSNNADYTKVSQVNVPIPHNLEARDSEIISTIISELTYDGIATDMGTIMTDDVKNVSNETHAIKYSFTPTISSLYKLSCSNNNLSIVVRDHDSYHTNKYNSNELVKLTANKTYDIYIHNNGNSYYNNFSVGFPTISNFINKNYTISANENMYISVLETTNNIIKYKANNTNVKIEVLNKSFQPITNNAEMVTNRYEANQKYYLKLNNSSANSQNFKLTQESIDVIKNDVSLSTTISNKYSYFKFVAPSSNTYVFDLGNSSTTFKPVVEMYSNSYQLISYMDVISAKNKDLYSVSLQQGETIYLAVKNNVNYNNNININADVSNYYWTIDGVVASNKIINMNRSGNDTIRVAYYCNGNQLEGGIKFVNGSAPYFVKSAYVDGFEYDITLKNNAELNLDGNTYLSFLFEAFEGQVAFVTQELFVSVDPYIDINLRNTTDNYDYYVIINTGAYTTISGESITVSLKLVTQNNHTYTQSFNKEDFNKATFIPPSTYFKVGNLQIAIYSVTYQKNSYSKTYYASSNSNLFSSSYSIIKKGFIQNGDGTESSPYLISSFRELNNIREFAVYDTYYDTYYIDGYFKLTNNIRCESKWKPIEACFRGKFDGNYRTISNLSMSITSTEEMKYDSYGLFRSAKNAAFCNLYISDVDILSATSSKCSIDIGTICGYASSSTFTQCYVWEGSIGENYIYSTTSIGGIVGYSEYSSFTECFAGENSNSLMIYGYGAIGGIIGTARGGSINNCCSCVGLKYYWDGAFNGFTGGIVGKAIQTVSIDSCYYKADIFFAGESTDSKELAPYMGQIVGYIDASTTLDNNEYEGTCNYNNLKKVGGFLGINKTDQGRYASKGECGYIEE